MFQRIGALDKDAGPWRGPIRFSHGWRLRPGAVCRRFDPSAGEERRMAKQGSFGKTALLIVVSAFFAASAAHGAFAQGTQQERSDCMGDAFQFCASAIPNVPEIETCLKSNISQLSPACRSEFEQSGRTRIKREHFG
jgi:hypothetical protein